MTPPDAVSADKLGDLARLLAIMARLRDPNAGCPWDVEQTFATIAPYTIEEAYEVADAIERGALDELKGELGDLLFQVVFHAQMAEEAGAFSFADVANAATTKMLERHPHVFGDATVEEAAAQERAWEAMKAEERARIAAAEGRTPSALDGVARALPALMRAQKLAKRAAREGFDYPDAQSARAKVDEELTELFEAVEADDAAAVAEEFGDVAFSVVCLAMKLGVDAEEGLRAANAKFERRFRAMEALIRARGETLRAVSLADMDAAWNEAKSQELVSPNDKVLQK